MALDAKSYYDQYWQVRDNSRTAARSRERAEITLRLLREPRDRRLLEFGCGPGWSLDMFRRAGYRVRGVDVSSVAVDQARELALDVDCVDIESDPIESLVVGDPPEVIVALEVLEHLVEPREALVRMGQALAPGGCLVVSLPNEIPLPVRLKILFGSLPFGGHSDPHVRHFDSRRAQELFQAAGYVVKESVAIHLLPPRWGTLRTLFAPLLACFPGLFSLATVYLLRRETPDGE